MNSVVTTLCEKCAAGPSGEAGHADLALYVGGPYPGQHIFKCNACGERWIRRAGPDSGTHAWARYSAEYPPRKPR